MTSFRVYYKSWRLKQFNYFMLLFSFFIIDGERDEGEWDKRRD
jgi:hypothetical protein